MPISTYKKIVRALGIIGLVVVVFIAGAYIGAQSSFTEKIFPTSVHASDSTAAQANLSEFWSIWNLIEQKYPFKKDEPTDKEKVYGAIAGLVASYDDPYTVFFPPKEAKLFNQEVKGSFGGVGMEVGLKDGIVTVVAPLKDSPAEKAGIHAGDIITEINDESTDGMDVDTAISLIRGDVGTSVTLTVVRQGESGLKEITIVRDIVKLPVIDTTTKGNVFIISLYSFSENSAALFKDALKKFNESDKRRLIIDLRGNPGGYLDSAVDIASYFLPAGKTIVRENSGTDKPEIVHQSKGTALLAKNPRMVILINGGSASASEILAGALSEHNVATLVGTKSFGKGSVQELVNLKDGSSVKITVAKWLTPNGVSISEKGIVPKIIIETKPSKDPKTGELSDPQLDAAIKALQ